MDFGLKQRLDYSDLEALPQDGKRYEILDGRIHVTPSPNPAHQRVCYALARQLGDYCEPRELGLVFLAPLDVILADHDIVEPDILVVPRGQLSGRGVEGSPLLVVEVLSPSTERVDRGTKAQRFALHGIQHFWVVDPVHCTLECRRLQHGQYERTAHGAGDGTVAVPDFPGLVIELAPLWL